MATATVTPLPLTPTAPSVPLALRVNGEEIILSDYQADLARLQQAQTELAIAATPEDQKTRILENFTDQLLLAQAATQAGFSVDDATLQARIDKLVMEIGGMDKLSAWQSTNGYSDESFRIALRRSILSAWQRDQIINSLPLTAEQIHARQILVQDEANANEAYAQLQAGVVFSDLAFSYDPVLGGDLGWFPAGTLTQPNVDEAVFALQPEQYTEVIKSDIGYHIVYVIERDPAHTLSIDARRMLQEKKIREWLDASRAVSTIEILLP